MNNGPARKGSVKLNPGISTLPRHDGAPPSADRYTRYEAALADAGQTIITEVPVNVARLLEFLELTFVPVLGQADGVQGRVAGRVMLFDERVAVLLVEHVQRVFDPADENNPPVPARPFTERNEPER